MNKPNHGKSNEDNGLRNSNQGRAGTRKAQPKPSRKGLGCATPNTSSVGAGNQSTECKASADAAPDIVPHTKAQKEIGLALVALARRALSAGEAALANILADAAQEVANLGNPLAPTV